MWKTFKALLSISKKPASQKLSGDFDQQVKKAMHLVENNNDTNIDDDKDFLNYLIQNGISEPDATEILFFLPIAFIRQLLPMIKWPDTYGELKRSNKSVIKKYSETKSYQIIHEITVDYFNNPNKDTVFKLAGRSAEFNLINHALLANPDLKVEDLKLSETILIR